MATLQQIEIVTRPAPATEHQAFFHVIALRAIKHMLPLERVEEYFDSLSQTDLTGPFIHRLLRTLPTRRFLASPRRF